MDKLCMVCGDGDVYGGYTCEDCDYQAEMIRELFDNIRTVLCLLNDIDGYVAYDLSKALDDATHKIHKQIFDVKLEWIQDGDTKRRVSEKAED